jgi:hypothetical protein
MEKVQQYRGEAYRRVPQFLDAHPDVFGAVIASEARKQLDAALTKLDSAVDIQGARSREARGEKNNQDVLERNLRDHHMVPVVKFALGKLAGTPNIKALTPSASQLKGARLADAARAMAVAAAPYTALFTAATFPADFAQQLTDAANAIQASIDARRRKIADRKNATSTVEESLKEARSAALQLEGVVGHLVPRGTPLHDEWESVKRVVAIAVRPTPAVTPAPLPATTPVATVPQPATPQPVALQPTAPQAQEGTAVKVA